MRKLKYLIVFSCKMVVQEDWHEGRRTFCFCRKFMRLQKLKVALLGRELMRTAVCPQPPCNCCSYPSKAGRENNLLFLQSVSQILSGLGLYRLYLGFFFNSLCIINIFIIVSECVSK